MSDADNNADFHEDESDAERKKKTGTTKRKEGSATIEEYYCQQSISSNWWKTYDRRTITDIEVGGGWRRYS